MDGGAILLELPEVISRSVLVNWLGLNTGVTRLDCILRQQDAVDISGPCIR
jgi:hypothetical protein